jgi:hypothetical protein
MGRNPCGLRETLRKGGGIVKEHYEMNYEASSLK